VTIGDLWTAPIAVPLPVVLAGGVGAVVATAAALSARAAHHPELPARRWSRPLPAALRRGADARVTRLALRALGLGAGVVGVLALAGHGAPVDGFVAIAVLTGAAMVAGPVHRLFDPIRTQPGAPNDHHGHHTPHDHAATGPGTNLRAAAWLIVFCAIALSIHDPRLLAATATGYVLLRLAGRWRGDGDRDDPVATHADLIAHLAPVGRDRDGLLAWRNPLVTVAHASLPRGAVGFAAVVIAASLTHAALQRAQLDGPATAVLLFAVILAGVAGALRLAVIRPFLRSTTVPLMAAYGVTAAGRWLPPVDLIAFVTLHVVAVGILHRQTLARYDLRTARAVQFPLRVVFVVSVVSGLAVLGAP
jgi:hypothetical protein